jgi:hypothetical protein
MNAGYGSSPSSGAPSSQRKDRGSIAAQVSLDVLPVVSRDTLTPCGGDSRMHTANSEGVQD